VLKNNDPKYKKDLLPENTKELDDKELEKERIKAIRKNNNKKKNTDFELLRGLLSNHAVDNKEKNQKKIFHIRIVTKNFRICSKHLFCSF